MPNDFFCSFFSTAPFLLGVREGSRSREDVPLAFSVFTPISSTVLTGLVRTKVALTDLQHGAPIFNTNPIQCTHATQRGMEVEKEKSS